MERTRVGRTILSVVSGYIANAALVGVTEAVYVRILAPREYFVVDVATQIAATIIAAYLCCLIAQGAKLIAAISLTALGLMIGTASLVTSWNAEPHWYGIALLGVYAPCVWIGYLIAFRRMAAL